MRVKGILDLIGNTPTVKLEKIIQQEGVEIFAKLEGHNLTGSMKARSALGMIEAAEARGELTPGRSTIIESTSGNLGYALAAIGGVKGYRVILVLDPKTDDLKRNILKGYGAELVTVTESDEHGAFQPTRIARVQEMLGETPNSWTPNQYHNPDNLDAHYKTMGPEIFADLEGRVDVVVGAIGTCGHLGGAAKFLMEQNPDLRVIGVEPEGSVLSGGEFCPYLIQGPGLSFKPSNLDLGVIREIVKVSDKDAMYAARELARKEAILSGSSAGSVIYATRQIAPELPEGSRVAVILADGGFRYGTNFYDDNWMVTHAMQPPSSQ
ncbi:cysteine synthase family protein [Candidatus Woesearchaeota archaeon]|jgi:2,3-diaminopropionate biosynthesis protein SbnA|nr:cysteine synthase family protein [Candidatus Woesearchaeota archaeon]MBT3538391.1 cysteine synthase family protein [Candidatus Woesearchaeota archaeon]MBT4697058.1 cysteine synthase family protein [Candidatus Woesearchaeota archaeon]MBT4716384.1 cysteine synthase family protein [Candidatus Woesearchaeota archaeon]MBT7106060.1 cysteine synthase family protein [Candidatus Woesearchaeota archaeon]